MAEKVLGIDYGSRRIGVAIADCGTRIATPLTTLDGKNDPVRNARMIADFGKEQRASSFVVGLPLNMSGTDSDQTRLTRLFAESLARLSGSPVHLHDERLTSEASNEVLSQAEIPPRHRKGLTDRIAAQIILQSWLDKSNTGEAPATESI